MWNSNICPLSKDKYLFGFYVIFFLIFTYIYGHKYHNAFETDVADTLKRSVCLCVHFWLLPTWAWITDDFGSKFEEMTIRVLVSVLSNTFISNCFFPRSMINTKFYSFWGLTLQSIIQLSGSFVKSADLGVLPRGCWDRSWEESPGTFTLTEPPRQLWWKWSTQHTWLNTVLHSI